MKHPPSPLQRGNVATERRISKLENLEISWRDSEKLFSLFTYSATTGNSQRVWVSDFQF